MYHLYKSYGKHSYALSGLNLKVRKGDFIFLTGASGAGKSTFLKLLYLEQFPTRGQLIVMGRNIGKIKTSQIPYLRRQIGVVFQDFKLLPYRTVYDNIAIIFKIFGSYNKESRKQIFNALRDVGMHKKMYDYPCSLSGGEQQRVAMVRALINNPPLILADEPTGNLHPELSEEVIRILKRINEKGTTIIVATHDKTLLNVVPARIVHLENGHIASDSHADLNDQDEDEESIENIETEDRES
jgi:cell division transport system ATP-binding protein